MLIEVNWTFDKPEVPYSPIRLDSSNKGAYGRWGGMVDVVERWMSVGGRGGWKMEDADGGRMGTPLRFPH